MHKTLICLILCFSISLNNQCLAVDKKADELILFLLKCISQAQKEQSKLPKEVLEISGYSSPKVRHFLNNVCSKPGTRYLEIGCWQGSTWVSALYGNSAMIEDAVAIDNWSEFGGPARGLQVNCEKFLNGSYYRFYGQDCFALDKSTSFDKPINVYFYDGNHSELSQELALTYYDDVLDELFILIIDDWNFEEVRIGTLKAIEKLQYELLYQEVLPATCNVDIENWWNGLFVAVVKKRKV